jgi:deoxyhypusine synthase
MKREDILQTSIIHINLKPDMTVNELIREFSNSASFGAGRISTACDIYEEMIQDEECTIFLALAGAMVPAGMRRIIVDLMRQKLINVLVSTGANIVHDLIESFGGHHYRGHWAFDDNMLYGYHIYRIYDIFVPEEDYVKADSNLTEIFDEIAEENKNKTLGSHEFVWEIGKRVKDPNSITRVAYETKTPVFLPAVRDSEFGYIHYLHSTRRKQKSILKLDTFKEVHKIVEIFKLSPHVGMIVIGGGVPRNTIQHAGATAKKGIDYAIVITMDRPESGGLSGSTLEETVSWGKLKKKAKKVMVICDATIAFPLIVAAVLERLGIEYERKPKLMWNKTGEYYEKKC